jgi:NADH dehydrogenase (ubiquinone) Fe-S protein 2
MLLKNQIKTLNINFGPQHPAAHGVLRLILNLSGEIINRAEPHIGLLHRGTEKIIEFKTIIQALPYFDRIDYVSMLSNEHSFAQVVESLVGFPISDETQLIRVILLELTRIINHLMSITTHAMDVGALTPFLWAFEEREKLMEFYERLSGARMHANYIRPCNNITMTIDLLNIFSDLNIFLDSFVTRLDELEELLTSNRIWITRLSEIGIINVQNALINNFSGVIIRSTGLNWDLRKQRPYERYSKLNFSVPVGKNGDCYDRYILRMFEMRQSMLLMLQCLNILNINYTSNLSKQSVSLKIKFKMEDLIRHFKYFSTPDLNTTAEVANETYLGTEAPKGEFGVYLILNNESRLYRCKLKAPGFFHLQGLNLMGKNHLIADIVTIIGTQDIVFGEVDR